jgi:hypothetical protein
MLLRWGGGCVCSYTEAAWMGCRDILSCMHVFDIYVTSDIIGGWTLPNFWGEQRTAGLRRLSIACRVNVFRGYTKPCRWLFLYVGRTAEHIYILSSSGWPVDQWT